MKIHCIVAQKKKMVLPLSLLCAEGQKHREMIQNPTSRSLAFQLFLTSFSLQFISGFSDHSMNSKHEANTKHHHVTSKSNTGTKVVVILLGLVAVGLFCFFLFKLYQKKKRQEQYARLLKLFEEDDELEVELGLRD